MRLKLTGVAVLAAVFFTFISGRLLAQHSGEKAIVKGRLTIAAANTPAHDVSISIPALRRLTTSDGNGEFSFSEVPYGNYTIIIGGALAELDSQKIFVDRPVTDIGNYTVRFAEMSAVAAQAELPPTIALEESDVNTTDDESVAGQNVSGLLTASRDPFLNTAAFVFGPYRFQPRGYDRNQQQVLINGAPMNDIETGDAYWSQWGGLNDVFRSRSQTYGLAPSEYTYGGINGSVFFDATAESQRKQTRFTYSLSNRSYNNRLMLTHSTGLMKNGWALSISASRRWAEEGYVEGTFYDGYSYYLGVSKKISNRHLVSFTTFGAPTRRGKVAPAIQEAYDLAGTNFYNPNWGYQNGEKRNAKVANGFQPISILTYEFTPSDRARWLTSLSYQFGKQKNSQLDYYKGDSRVRPDYYRNFPSYYEAQGEDPANAEFLTHKQIDWDRIYQSNYGNFETVYNANSVAGNNVYGRRSIYIEANDVDEIQKYTFNTNLAYVVTDHITYTGGLTYLNQRTSSYREADDLLGGDFYVNLNQFAERDYISESKKQYDLNNPNRLIKAGDRYFYDYINRFEKAWMFQQLAFTYNKVDFFLSVNAGFNAFSREGLVRNGLFSSGNQSFGKGSIQRFSLYGAKGGITYKINGRHYIFLNGALQSDAPTVDNTYISGRTRNATIDNPREQMTYSAEGGYLLKSPKVNARVVGYATDVRDATDIKRFYNTGSGANSFTNFVMSGVDMRFIGTELALDVKVTPSLTVTAVAALGQAFYTNNPEVSISQDLDTTNAILKKDVYVENYYIAAGPQTATTLGLNYRSKKFWYASVNLNYFDRNYVDIGADRRSVEATDNVPVGSDAWHLITDQEKLPSAVTVDVFGGKSWLLNKYNKRIPRSWMVYLNAGISNLLDNKDIRTGGFEQLRYDYANTTASSFPSKYFYNLGRNFFVNLSLKF